ncbi:hypothetical protein AB0I28_04500 [Phytomonospora sp. NPDC050363]|uniref:hypothetical protein n=1 Tax=Phytomonospora sp. NPDC050363 TaxID=3155642 RepID=UPI0033ED8AF8
MKADLDRLRWFAEFCERTRGVSDGARTQGVQAIADIITRTELGLASFGGEEAPWSRELMAAWNGALEWRRNEASSVARELLYYVQALEKVAREYDEEDRESAAELGNYHHA